MKSRRFKVINRSNPVESQNKMKRGETENGPTYILALQIFNLLSYVIMISLNVIANVYPFNGNPNNVISAKYPTSFTPAGYAFSIWSLIFLAMGAFNIYQVLPRNRKSDGFVSKISIALIINQLVNGTWNIAFAYEVLPLSLVMMFTILITLIFIYVRLEIGKNLGATSLYFCSLCSKEKKQGVYEAQHTVKESLIDFWCLQFPFSIYLGWISVATIANFAVLLVSEGYNSWSEGWSILMQCVAVILAGLMLLFHLDVSYSSIISWALVAIGVGQSDKPIVSTAGYSLGCLVAILTFAVFCFRMVKFYRFTQTLQQI
eukprot:TRINITY_DN8176_c0_g1_i1.p1 TRINITY_DN8176_c0_g1~~TRINITY_DN8176_c0_g1_i1.p1  ORF type:complete len:317 (-),score=16.10 TRINITY_DN8176_c0_g1_i1:62-1012(-)